jgi:hypothetical protein
MKRREIMSSVNVMKRLSRKSLAQTLLLSFGIALSFSLVLTVPAVAQDAYPKGIASGGGVWEMLGPGFTATGVTSFSIRANFPGNASGGFVYVKGVGSSGPISYRIAIEPETAVILNGEWNVWPAPDEPPTVEGDAMWAIGQVVAAEGPNLLVGHWVLVGAYDGAESDYGTDYLLVFNLVDQVAAEAAYAELLSGNQLFPLWVFLAQGNAVLNVLED